MLLLFILEDGARSLFEKLYHKCRAAMWYRAFELTGNQTQADDAVQSAFANLLGKADLLSTLTDRQLKAYVMVTVKHCALRISQREKRLVSLDEIPEPAEQTTPEDMALHIWEQLEVRQAVANLPEIDRDLLFLRYDIGLDYESIRRQTGLTNGAARTRVSRAIAALRVLLRKKEVI